MKKICNRRLSPTEPKHKILTLPTTYRIHFPKPKTTITIIDSDGFKGTGKMHSSGLTRIDGLGWWYRRHPSIKVGTMVGVYKDDNNNYIIKLEDTPNEEKILEESFENEVYEEDFTSLSFEKDLENALVNNLTVLEDGLKLFKSQYPIDYEDGKCIIDINGLKLAVSNLSNIFLKKYNINFTFEDIK